jgi:hypothetical protein
MKERCFLPTAECSRFEQRPDLLWRRPYAKGTPERSQNLQSLIPYKKWLREPCAHHPLEVSVKTKAESARYCGHLRNRSYVTKATRTSEAEKIIGRIRDVAQNQDLRDENEAPPVQEVVTQAIFLIRDAGNLLGIMPSAQVSTFYGEVNITWRTGDRIVRLACFPDRPTVIQIGSLSQPTGFYRSEENPTAMLLAARLSSLAL